MRCRGFLIEATGQNGAGMCQSPQETAVFRRMGEPRPASKPLCGRRAISESGYGQTRKSRKSGAERARSSPAALAASADEVRNSGGKGRTGILAGLDRGTRLLCFPGVCGWPARFGPQRRPRGFRAADRRRIAGRLHSVSLAGRARPAGGLTGHFRAGRLRRSRTPRPSAGLIPVRWLSGTRICSAWRRAPRRRARRSRIRGCQPVTGSPCGTRP